MAIIIPSKRKFLAPPLVRMIDDQRDPLNFGLVGHWSMDAETVNGTRMLDLSGRDNHGTLIASPPIVPGRVGQGLSFNGSNQYVSVPSSAVLNFGASNFTLSMWFTSTGTTSLPELLSKGAYSVDGFYIEVNDTNGAISFVGGANITTSQAGAYAVNSLYHFAATKIASQVYLWLNGAPLSLSRADSTSPLTPSSTPFVIGAYNGGAAGFFKGLIDDVRAYNRALTPAEIFALYNNPARDGVPYQTRGRIKSSGGLSTITGTLAVTEANDTIAAVGRVAVGGTLARTEAADTISAAGGVAVAGTLSRTEANDTLAATGTVAALGAITGTLSAFQAVQTLIATGQIRVNGGLAVTQAAQTLAATGIVGSVVPPPAGQGVQVIVIS